MVKVGTAEYDVTIDRAKVQAEVNATSATIERGLGGSAAKVESAFVTGAKSAAKAFALYKGVGFTNDIIQSASDLTEQQQKINVVFGNSSKIVADFADTSAEAFGVSRREALTTAGTFGNLFRTIGIAQPTAAKMSTTLVGLAADLASYSNTDPGQALDALQSGLVGLTRPLRQYGILLDQATLKQKAQQLGLYDGTGQLSSAARVQASYAVILEKSSLQQGDFARTGNNLAQQQKKLSAEWDNAKVALGQALVPALKDFVVVGRGALQVYNGLPGAVQAGIPAVLGLALAAPKVISGFKGTGEALVNFRLGLMGVTQEGAGAPAALGGLISSMGGIGVAGAAALPIVIGLGGAAYGFAHQAEEAAARAAALSAGIQKLEAYANETGKSVRAVFGPTTLREFIKDNAGVLDTLGISNKELTAGVTGSRKEYDKFNSSVLRSQNNLANHAGDVENFKNAIEDLRGRFTGARESVNKHRTELDALGISTDKATEKTTAETKALEDQAKWRQAVVDGAQAQVQKSHDLYSAKVAEQGTSKALTQAIADEATARKAAAGDSDEYRAAIATIASDEKAVQAATRDTQKAIEALSDARESARRGLRDERLETERSAIASERAKLALLDSQDALAKTQDDPRATDRQKQQAALDLADASLSVQDANNKRTDSAADLAKAEKAGVDGSDAVVSAKERVASASDAQGKAEQQVATDTKAAAKIIDDAKLRVADASDKVRAAVLTEADAQEKIATLAYGAAAGNDAFNASLERTAVLLDPNSDIAKSLAFFAEVSKALAGNVDTLAHPPGPVTAPTRDPDKGPRLASKNGGVGTGSVVDRSQHITVNTTNGPSAQQVANEMAFGN